MRNSQSDKRRGKSKIKSFISLYGNVSLIKAWCEACLQESFVVDGVLQCCDNTFDEQPKATKRESEPPQKRKLPGKTTQETILQDQDFRCFYCEQSFGKTVTMKGKTRTLQVNWDHSVPWSYSQDNGDNNFVAACDVCNRWKSNKIFTDLHHAKIYLNQLWDKIRGEL